ncbi:iron-siderophore ABC transporter substrate-binding protein [Agreia sp. PsM10]|uniref:ABC transporter substrate-binding protein n=1 Tax=Agreia sp. PsM10 TaxID=3030533 RepID=UPI00263AB7CE|nr:iron-siderophore ABC transporter substrate-binding protein [Agreia sp. PsM10]MDN4641762.1 iron-siderophore ABC transporter substrate-binding protein [Agreia sp. PsM10]
MPAIQSTRRASLAAVLLAALALTGCSTATPESTSPSTADAHPVEYVTPRTMPEGKGSGADDGVFPRTVAHFAGETVIDRAPEKVVVISTGQADALLTLGVVPIGSTSGDGADMVPPYLYDAFPDEKDALDAVTYVGSRFEPDVETIANLAPDLILMSSAGKDATALYASLSAIAPTVVTQGTGLYWKQDFLLLADSIGKTGQAEQWLDNYQNDAQAFGATVEGAPTVSFLRKNADRTRVFGVASFSGSVAEDAGLARPESQQFVDDTSVDISSEQLDQADADWIFYGVQGGDDSQLTSLPLWPTLAAVDDEQVVAVDDDVFYLNVGPTAARGVLSQLEETLAG